MECPGWIRTIPIAHRGLHDAAGGIPENSRAAFERAASAFMPIELDVRIARCGTPVVFHDASTGRLCGADLEIARTGAARLRAERLGATGETIPTLGDALVCIAGRVPVLVEIKPECGVGALPDIAAVLGGARVAVQSFDPRIVDWFRRHMPEMPRGQLVTASGFGPETGALRRAALRHALFDVVTRPHFVAVELGLLRRSWLWRRRARRGVVLAWTVSSPRDHAFCRALGTNVIFEGGL